ncbi:hypothetical protein QBC43DRAFT_354029 [Cladorrhinum sp. PSN259]|nr:hypothetical protein QBC43DRAFT_354029 [Cladorrhinum sp. PSN259]
MGGYIIVPARLSSSQHLFMFFAVAAAQNATAGKPDSSETVVSWYPTPTTRGSLELVYSCLLTIFACTWTVLHLNVPAREDGMWTRIIRKVKWMAITVLLPEFIFAKSICDLRLALHDLSEFGVMIKQNYKDGFQEVSIIENDDEKMQTVVRDWKWQVKYGRAERFLYRLMGLKEPPAPPPEQEANLSTKAGGGNEGAGTEAMSQDIQLTRILSPLKRMLKRLSPRMRSALSSPQHATETGGETTVADTELHVLEAVGEPPGVVEDRSHQNKALSDLTRDKNDETLGPRRDTPEASTREPGRCVGGGGSNSDQDSDQDSDQNSHVSDITYSILQHWTLRHAYLANMGGLVYLSDSSEQCLRKDTKYVALTGAKLSQNYYCRFPRQVHCLTLLARAVLNLPISLIEISTAAFAIFAIATYAATFWKPKDVSRPIVLQSNALGFQDKESDKHYDWTQSFFRRLISPAATRELAKDIRDVNRVKNDMVWMPENTQSLDGLSLIPLVFVLMAVSSFIFGRLHCLAWNFKFPSRTELILWRVAALASTIIPTLSLMASLVLPLLLPVYNNRRGLSSLLAQLDRVAQFPPRYLQRLKEPTFARWRPWAIITLMKLPTGSRNFGEEPTVEAQNRTVEEIKRMGTEDDYNRAVMHIRNFPFFFTSFLKLWNAARNGTQDPRILSKLLMTLRSMQDRLPLEAQDIWDDYEDSYLRKAADNGGLPEVNCISHIMTTLKGFEAKRGKTLQLRDTYFRFQTIGSGILYISARFIIIVLTFTALRAAPVGVYENTPWTRLLPTFS